MYTKSYNDAFFVTLVSVALITLNPFHLDTPQYDDFWEWLIYPPDVAQNILLFIPVGAAIQSVTRPSLLFTMLTGFAFSLTIESLQLYIPERHSNFIDLITNTVGAGG